MYSDASGKMFAFDPALKLFGDYTAYRFMQSIRESKEQTYRDILTYVLDGHSFSLETVANSLSSLPEPLPRDYRDLRPLLIELCVVGTQVCCRLDQEMIDGEIIDGELTARVLAEVLDEFAGEDARRWLDGVSREISLTELGLFETCPPTPTVVPARLLPDPPSVLPPWLEPVAPPGMAPEIHGLATPTSPRGQVVLEKRDDVVAYALAKFPPWLEDASRSGSEPDPRQEITEKDLSISPAMQELLRFGQSLGPTDDPLMLLLAKAERLTIDGLEEWLEHAMLEISRPAVAAVDGARGMARLLSLMRRIRTQLIEVDERRGTAEYAAAYAVEQRDGLAQRKQELEWTLEQIGRLLIRLFRAEPLFSDDIQRATEPIEGYELPHALSLIVEMVETWRFEYGRQQRIVTQKDEELERQQRIVTQKDEELERLQEENQKLRAELSAIPSVVTVDPVLEEDFTSLELLPSRLIEEPVEPSDFRSTFLWHYIRATVVKLGQELEEEQSAPRRILGRFRRQPDENVYRILDQYQSLARLHAELSHQSLQDEDGFIRRDLNRIRVWLEQRGVLEE